MIETVTTTFATMFVMIDPIGLTPMFAALTAGMPQSTRAKIAFQGVIVAAIILAIFAVAGDLLLTTIGVSLPAFRIAGGVMLFLLSIEMLFQKRTERREKETDESLNDNDPSVFPLATPLIAGPGVLAAIILLNTEYGSSGQGQLGVFLATFAVLIICFLCFLTANYIERFCVQPASRFLPDFLACCWGPWLFNSFLTGSARTGLRIEHSLTPKRCQN